MRTLQKENIVSRLKVLATLAVSPVVILVGLTLYFNLKTTPAEEFKGEVVSVEGYESIEAWIKDSGFDEQPCEIHKVGEDRVKHADRLPQIGELGMVVKHPSGDLAWDHIKGVWVPISDARFGMLTKGYGAGEDNGKD